MKLNYKTQQTHIYFFYSKTLFFKIQIYAYQNSIFGVHVLQISNSYNWISKLHLSSSQKLVTNNMQAHIHNQWQIWSAKHAFNPSSFLSSSVGRNTIITIQPSEILPLFKMDSWKQKVRKIKLGLKLEVWV